MCKDTQLPKKLWFFSPFSISILSANSNNVSSKKIWIDALPHQRCIACLMRRREHSELEVFFLWLDSKIGMKLSARFGCGKEKLPPTSQNEIARNESNFPIDERCSLASWGMKRKYRRKVRKWRECQFSNSLTKEQTKYNITGVAVWVKQGFKTVCKSNL